MFYVVVKKDFTGVKSILSHDKLLKRLVHLKADKVLQSQITPRVSTEEQRIYFWISHGLLTESLTFPTKSGGTNKFKEIALKSDMHALLIMAHTQF